ncbi:glycine-rich domain-containing protein [Streptomyces sp. NPDC055793]
MSATTTALRTGRELIDDELFDSIARMVMHEKGRDRAFAEQVTDQAVAFVYVAATSTVPMVPSDDVDEGLHAFILHTPDHHAFCQQHAGRFLHHNARPGVPRTVEDVARSAQAMKAAGFRVTDDRWSVGDTAFQCDSDCGRPYGQ